ncbi:MAG: redoxin domain-containing protein [Inquilinus sp.]|nr:redoxin domain-containing protein [Inquilinus sp.]
MSARVQGLPVPAIADREAPLAPGDRAPDFLLPDQNRSVDPWYNLVQGGRIVLHFYPGNGKAAYRAELDALVRQHAALAERGVEFYAVNTDALDANVALAAAEEPPFLLFTDPGGRVRRRYGVPVLDPRKSGAQALGSVVTFVLDFSQRVLETIQGRGLASHARQALACLDRLGPVSEAETVTMPAPVLIVPRVLDRAFCQRLIAIWHERGNRESGTITMGKSGRQAKEIRHDVKRRRDHHVQDPALFAEISDTVFRRIQPEVERAFDTKLSRVEEFKIVRYDAEEGGFFRPHRDNSIPDKAQRRFAMTLNLNTEEYEGGELRFPEFGPNLYRPGTGDAVVFSCSLLHEALDVTKGCRFTLLSFLLDGTPDRWRTARTQWFNRNVAELQDGLKAQKPRR